MREAFLSLRGIQCSITNRGRISVNEPDFTATVSELETMGLLAQGFSTEQVAGERHLKINYIRMQLKRLQTTNRNTTTGLIGIAAKLDLLNPLAIEGVRFQAKLLQDKVQKSLDVTEEFEAIKTKVVIQQY